MVRQLPAWARRHPSLPLMLLVVLCAASLLARGAWLGGPCHLPCRNASDHVLVFDEDYYVNAARVIAGLRPPATAPYADAPAGADPNAEHPQLVKLIMAGSIELFGDGPFAWRLGSLVAGTLALLGLFALVRVAGGGVWLALGAAALMAFDNLLLVHGRIGTLDIYVVAAMIWAAAAYLRGRPILAGALLALAACCKLVAVYGLLALAVLEFLKWLRRRGGLFEGFRRLAFCSITATAGFVALLALMDELAPPYDPLTGRRVTGGPFGHLGHMLSYAANQTSPHGPQGIASYPWQWLGDYKPITYLNINPARPVPGLLHVHPAAHFFGVISPPILLLLVPALVLAVRDVVRRLPRPSDDVGLVGLAWSTGTFVPFELLSLIWQRTSYLYYMVIVMPGVYLMVVEFLARLRRHRRLLLAWVAAVVAAAVVLYPFTPLP